MVIFFGYGWIVQLKGILECNGCVQPEISTEGGSCLVFGGRILDNYRRHVPAHRDGESEESGAPEARYRRLAVVDQWCTCGILVGSENVTWIDALQSGSCQTVDVSYTAHAWPRRSWS